MGKIFSWQEIESGRVPKLTHFSELSAKVRRELEELPAIIGGIVCGSVNQGLHNVRSDLDCVVLYKWHEREAALRIFRYLYFVAKNLNIPLELIPIDSESAKTPCHVLVSAFLGHLKQSAELGGIIKTNPLDQISPSITTFQEDARQYLVHKTRKLEKVSAAYSVLDGSSVCLFLQKMLEMPVHAARKMIRCFDFEMLNGDSKTEVQRIYPLLPITNIDRATCLLDQTTRLDRRYDELLVESLAGKSSAADYWIFFREMYEHTMLVLEFAKINLAALAR